MREFGIRNTSERQPDARVKKGGVDAVGVHIGYALVGVEAALFAFIVGHRVVADDAVAGANGTERSEAPAAAERLAVDAQTLFAVLVDKQAWCAIPKGGLDVVLPKI